tara:strand:+ start:197834 stop:198136 length:303 start_codon:yes stop_codon:yes gene_type:complete
MNKKTTMVNNAIAKRMLNADVNLVITADHLANQYGKALLDTSDMADILNLKEHTVKAYITTEKLPFKVTKIGGKWFTTTITVAQYVIDNQVDKSQFASVA